MAEMKALEPTIKNWRRQTSSFRREASHRRIDFEIRNFTPSGMWRNGQQCSNSALALFLDSKTLLDEFIFNGILKTTLKDEYSRTMKLFKEGTRKADKAQKMIQQNRPIWKADGGTRSSSHQAPEGSRTGDGGHRIGKQEAAKETL